MRLGWGEINLGNLLAIILQYQMRGIVSKFVLYFQSLPPISRPIWLMDVKPLIIKRKKLSFLVLFVCLFDRLNLKSVSRYVLPQSQFSLEFNVIVHW